MNLHIQYKRLFKGRSGSNDAILLRENIDATAIAVAKSAISKLKTALKPYGVYNVYFDENLDLPDHAKLVDRAAGRPWQSPGPGIVIQWKWNFDSLTGKDYAGGREVEADGVTYNLDYTNNKNVAQTIFNAVSDVIDQTHIDVATGLGPRWAHGPDTFTTPNAGVKTLARGGSIGSYSGPGSVTILPIASKVETTSRKLNPEDEPYQVDFNNIGTVKAPTEFGTENLKIKSISLMYWGNFIQLNAAVPGAEEYYGNNKFLMQIKAHVLKLKSNPDYKNWINEIEAYGQHTAVDIEKAIKRVDYTEAGMNTSGDIATEYYL